MVGWAGGGWLQGRKRFCQERERTTGDEHWAESQHSGDAGHIAAEVGVGQGLAFCP